MEAVARLARTCDTAIDACTLCSSVGDGSSGAAMPIGCTARSNFSCDRGCRRSARWSCNGAGGSEPQSFSRPGKPTDNSYVGLDLPSASKARETSNPNGPERARGIKTEPSARNDSLQKHGRVTSSYLLPRLEADPINLGGRALRRPRALTTDEGKAHPS